MVEEAHYRKGNKAAARTAYIDGIRLSFDLLMSNYGSAVPSARIITAVSYTHLDVYKRQLLL